MPILPQVYCYVLYGKGGFLTSVGMKQLADRLGRLSSRITVTTGLWKTCLTETIPIIRSQPGGTRIILIGYSLGANAVLQIADAIPKCQIDLAVAYDPSIYAEPNITKVGANVKRCLCYHNVGSSQLGHSLFKGPQVEVTEINQAHLLVDFNEELHLKTIGAVLRVVCEDEPELSAQDLV